jgi:hypothetical protein
MPPLPRKPEWRAQGQRGVYLSGFKRILKEAQSFSLYETFTVLWLDHLCEEQALPCTLSDSLRCRFPMFFVTVEISMGGGSMVLGGDEGGGCDRSVPIP